MERKKKEIQGSTSEKVEIVLFNYKTFRYMPVREGWESFVRNNVTGSNFMYGDVDYRRFKKMLSDTLYHIYNKAPGFFDTMSCLDPTGSGNGTEGGDGGYQILQCFLMFLQEDKVIVTDKKLKASQKKLTDAMTDTYKFRRLMQQWIINETDYFTGCEDIMTELDRGPFTKDEEWVLFKPILEKALVDQFNPTYDGDVFARCFTLPKKSSQPELDVKHFMVFAKATKTRIVLIMHHRSNNWSMKENNDSFLVHDFDWRYSDTDPEYKFSTSIPDFGQDFDFFRTAIFMRSPGCLRADQDYIYWLKEKGEQVMTMWLPQSYDPTKEDRNNVAKAKRDRTVTIGRAAGNMVGAAAEDNEETGPRETLPTNVEVEEEKEEATGPGEDNEEAGPGKTSHTDVEVEEDNEEATGPGENIQNDGEDEDSEHTARPHNSNSNDNKGKRNAWSRDGPDNKYERSTLCMLIEWLKSDRNYNRWKMKEDGKKGAMQEKLAKDINKAGKDLVPPRNRKGKAIGEKIVSLEHRMQQAVKVVDSQLQKPKGLRGDKLMARIRKEFHYFEELYPVMKDALKLRDIFAEMRGEEMQRDPSAASVSVEGVAGDVQLANTSNSSNRPLSTLEKLEIEGKAIDIYAKRQEQRLKDYQVYCDFLKDKTDHDFIANCFPTLIFFFKKEDFEEVKYRNYVKLYNDAVKRSGVFEPMIM